MVHTFRHFVCNIYPMYHFCHVYLLHSPFGASSLQKWLNCCPSLVQICIHFGSSPLWSPQENKICVAILSLWPLDQGIRSHNPRCKGNGISPSNFKQAESTHIRS